MYAVLDALGCETTRQTNRGKNKTTHQKNKRPPWQSNDHAEMIMKVKLHVHPIRFLRDTCQIECIYRYEGSKRKFWRKNENNTRCREKTRARRRTPPAKSGTTSTLRHVEQTPHRIVDPISRYRVYISKPRLNLIARSLGRQGRHIHICIYY